MAKERATRCSKVPTDLLFLFICSTQEKCYQYWPDQGCWTYGSIRVCVEDCVVLVDYTIRKFCIQSVSTLHPGLFWRSRVGSKYPSTFIIGSALPAALTSGG